MLADAVHAAVDEVARELSNRRTWLHLKRFVDHDLFPFALSPVKQPQLPVRIPAAVPDLASHINGRPRHRHSVKGKFAAAFEPRDLALELVGNGFVGVEAENYVIGGRIDGKLFLRGKARPFVDDHPRTEPFGDLARPVSTARIDHQHLVGPIERANGVGDLRFLVKRDNDGRDLHA